MQREHAVGELYGATWTQQFQAQLYDLLARYRLEIRSDAMADNLFRCLLHRIFSSDWMILDTEDERASIVCMQSKGI